MPLLNTATSVVDYLKSKSKPSDFNSRTNLYNSLGLSTSFGDYRGTPDQNTTLLRKLSTTPNEPALPTSPDLDMTPKDVIDQTGPSTTGTIYDLALSDEEKALDEEKKSLSFDLASTTARGAEGLQRDVNTLNRTASEGLFDLEQAGVKSKAKIGEAAAGFGGAMSGSTKKSQAEVAQEVVMKQDRVKAKLGDALYNTFTDFEKDFGTEFLSKLSIPEAESFSKLPIPVRGIVMNNYQEAFAKAEAAAQKNALSTLEKLGYTVIGGQIVQTLAGRTADRQDLSADRADKQLAISERRLELAEEAANRAITNNGLNTEQTATFLRISDKYQADSIINNGDKAITANTIADQVIANPGSAGNQLKILYTLIKSLDPDTAVREGELSLAQQIQSYLGRFGTALQRVSEGKLITEEATIELANATKSLVSLWQEAAARRTKDYDSQAAVAGIGDAWSEYKLGSQTIGETGTNDISAGLDDEEAYKIYLRLKGGL